MTIFAAFVLIFYIFGLNLKLYYIMAITVNPDKCPQNHRCPLIALCPVDAISQIGTGLPAIDGEKCIECGSCVENCGTGAMQFGK